MNKGLKIFLYIIVSFTLIIGGGIYLGKGLYNFFEGLDDGFNYDDFQNYDDSILYVDISRSNLVIKLGGNEIKVDNSNPNITSYATDNRVYIREYYDKAIDGKDYTVTVSIPEDVFFASTYISTGIGTVEIESLKTDYLNLSLDTGEVNFNYLQVTDEAIIEGEFSNLTISSGLLNNLDYDVDTGNVKIDAIIKGKNRFETDSGNLALSLRGLRDDYKFNIRNFDGKVTLDGENVSNGVIGSGKSIIYIANELASVDIKILDIDKNMENSSGSSV